LPEIVVASVFHMLLQPLPFDTLPDKQQSAKINAGVNSRYLWIENLSTVGLINAAVRVGAEEANTISLLSKNSPHQHVSKS